MKKAKLISLLSVSIFVILSFSALLLFRYSANEPILTETKEETRKETHTNQDEIPTSSQNDQPTLTQKQPENTEHKHLWKIKSLTDPVCEKNGLRVLSCSCGEKIDEIIPKLEHQFEGGSCISPEKCVFCGKEGEKKGHEFQNAVCLSCGQKITSQIYALGTSFDFDESENSIIAKLGTPTEILTEGKFRSLIYARSSKLTVFQTDSEGLWGVFTMDPDAFFHVGEKVVDFANFSGKKDPNSDTIYQNVGAFRVFAFRDQILDNGCYGMWIHYSDMSYNYMQNPDISDDYSAQSRISFYYVNALRSRHGLAPLAWSPAAAEVSITYSKKMVREDFFAHDYKCGERLTESGVIWKTCGENLSQGYTNAFFVGDAYYNSQGHRSNVLSHDFTFVGIGFALKNDEKGPTSVLGAQTYFS